MAWSGGLFGLNFDWTDERDAGSSISAADMDSQQEEIRAGIEATRHMGGQNAATANLPMGGFKHTSVSSASNLDDYAKVSQVQGNQYAHARSDGSTVQGAITAAIVPVFTAKSSGMTVVIFANTASSNKTRMGLNHVSTTELVLMDETTVSTDDIVAGRPIQAVFSGNKWWMVSPSHRTAMFADHRSFSGLSTVDTVTGGSGLVVMTTVAATGTVAQTRPTHS